jgi:hypothetical protein
MDIFEGTVPHDTQSHRNGKLVGNKMSVV